jgi:hypothetical protein
MSYSNWWADETVSVMIEPPTADDQDEYPAEVDFYYDLIEDIGKCVSAAFNYACDNEYAGCRRGDADPKIVFKSKQYFVGLVVWCDDYVVVFGVNPELENSYYPEDKRTLTLAKANYALMAEKFFDRLQVYYPLWIRTSSHTRGKRELKSSVSGRN